MLLDGLPIEVTKTSRRMLLKGVGAALAIPMLESLMPRAARAQNATPAPLFVFAQTTHGRWQGSWYPRNAPLASVGANVRAARLANLPGPLGRSIGTSLDDLRNKVNLIQGMDFMSITGHDHYPYTAGGRTHFTDGDPRNFIPNFPWSIDAVLARSSVIYPSPASIPVLRLNPRVGGDSFSYDGLQADGFAVNPTATGRTLTDTWNTLARYITPGSMPQQQVDAAQVKRRFLVDQVLAQYRAVASSSKLSQDDKRSLSNYADHVQEVQRRLGAGTTTPPAPTAACAPITVNETTDNVAFNDRLADMLALAMACGITRIATYDLNWASCADATRSVGDDVWHGQDGVHSASNGAGFDNCARWTAQSVRVWGTIARKLDQLGLLDRAVCVYTSDMSSSVPNHHTCDIPVLTAGGLNGKLRTGEFISYHDTSRPLSNAVGGLLAAGNETPVNGQYQHYAGRRWNELLISIFRAAGLSPADYQRNGQTGFGEYDCTPRNGNQALCGSLTGDSHVHAAMIQYYRGATGSALPRDATLPYFYL